MAPMNRRIMGDIKQVIAVLARLFGQVHGLIGMAYEHIGIYAFLRVKGDADAGGDLPALIWLSISDSALEGRSTSVAAAARDRSIAGMQSQH